MTGLGHEAVGAQLWRKFTPDALLDFIITHDQNAHDALVGFLDRTLFRHPLVDAVKAADRDSVDRDVNPRRRWEPKRSDLHIVRRFIEYAGLCAWNLRDAPFLMADLWIDGEDTGIALPFFRASWFHLHAFHDYLMSEDLYGCAIPAKRPIIDICEKLEHYGILSRTVPSVPPARLIAFDAEQVPAFVAKLHFPGEDGELFQKQPLAYFPLGARIAWQGMVDTRVILS